MESQTADTAEKKREWSDKRIACEAAMEVMQYVLPMLSRVQYWMTFLQTTTTPTMSLTIYIVKDLLKVGENLADKASNMVDEGIDVASSSDARNYIKSHISRVARGIQRRSCIRLLFTCAAARPPC